MATSELLERREAIVEVKYRCTNPRCKAEDTVRLFAHEATPPILNCWKCHAGWQKEYQEQLARQIGMVPIPQDEKKAA